MTRDEAFEKVIFTRGISKELGVPDYVVRSLRQEFKKPDGKISIDKKIEILLKAGYRMIQQEAWDL